MTEELAHLLEIAGPELANQLIRQFQIDLADVQTRLTAGFPAQDWPVLRSASHVLIALAGTAGAPALEQAAHDLNLAAKDRNLAAIAALSPQVLQGLDALIHLITQIATDRSAKI